MRPSNVLAVVAAFAYTSTAFSFFETDDSEGAGFTVEQEEAPEKGYHHGVFDVEHVYRRYNGTVPEHVKAAADGARRGAHGTAPNHPGRFDSFYVTPVLIGTPAQKLGLDLDTGSSDLWVFSASTPKGQSKGHKRYKPRKSKTAKHAKGLSWRIRYADGSGASGSVYHDKVRFGGVTVGGQAVETAKRVSGSFKRNKAIDGLFGFGFSNINTVRPRKQKTFFDNAKSKLSRKVLGVRLNHRAPGAFDVGYLNKKHYKGKVHYAKVNSRNGFWQFKTTGYTVGKSQHFGTNFNAIADTGTSLAYIPQKAINHYWRHVPSAYYERQVGGIIFKCNQHNKLRSFSVTVGGSRRTIPGKFINAGPVGQGYCFGGLQPNTGTGGLTILGDTFLKSQYAVFDLGKKRVGFANK